MNRVQQMASVTELKKETVKVFGELDAGPVVVASHSKPAVSTICAGKSHRCV
ncbi:MAG: hypothetical protein KDE19_05580 [Caldilineaceae bacterium]|nr:hypothetical protein [Caldilineaceae bacterium]